MGGKIGHKAERGVFEVYPKATAEQIAL